MKLAAALISLLSLVGAQALAEGRLTAYFSNDSVNGVKISDAYETHNMGLTYGSGGYYATLDLGIVSPDMHIYKNRFREANRSFGEIISFEVGQDPTYSGPLNFYGRLRSAGHYKIDAMQEFAHRVLSLQRVAEVNDLVRMPDANWYGAGARYAQVFNSSYLGDAMIDVDAYVGTDTISADVSVAKYFDLSNIRLETRLGSRLVAFDEIISADPIGATPRNVIPYASAGIVFGVWGYEFYLRDTFSLPTISSDDRLFGVLDAGLSFDF